MSSYLLGTQCLFDLGRNDGGALQQWFEGRAPQRGLFVDDIVLSAFSVSIIHRHFALKPPTKPAERTLQDNLVILIKRFGTADQIVGASPAVIDAWTRFRDDPITYRLPDDSTQRCGLEEKLVLATAMCGNNGRSFTLLDRTQTAFTDLNIAFQDPYKAP
ncbi:MAG: hypothetical protein JSR28_13770 [Proteobacteria bacterium]|nr:hypothetical protein [Pseudomonadota bacterium]